MDDTDVTIAIFVHNALQSLKTTLYSVVKNTGHPYSLLLIDDASDQATKSHLRSLKGATLITDEHQMGFPHNANLSIEHSTTPFIVLVNSDTYVTKGWLSLLIDCLKEDDHHGIAGPSTSFAWSDQRIVDRPDWTYDEIEEFGSKTYETYGRQTRYLDRLHSICGFCYAFKRRVVEDIGYFDETYGLGQCEEIDYNTRAAKAGYKCVWVCGAYVHHFGGKSFSQSSAASLLEQNKRIYQNKFCSLRTQKSHAYCDDCLGEDCEHFSRPENLKHVFRKKPIHKVEHL